MKRLIMLAAGLLAVLAITAAPGSAGVANPSAGCNWSMEGAGLFDSIGSLTSPGRTARGAGVAAKEPGLNESYEALPDSAKGKGGKGFKVTVPLWFHVISDGSIGNVTQSQIDAQMTVLNLAYSGFYGGVDTGFRFALAGVTRTDNASWFDARAGGGAEREMKQALQQGDAGTLNVYSSTANAYLGWAYLPGLPESRSYLDGIVNDWESMPGTSTRYAGAYDLGFTLVHESGHWFNLEHTFFGGCNAKGDFVDDTPAMLVPTNGCPEGKDTCLREPGLDPIHNYLDYSYDSCYNQFTAGQRARMQDAWLYYRA